jgi:phosphohistidine phosphatase
MIAMRLYLLRHGIAEDGIGMPDAQRQLTQEGRKKLRKVLERARDAGIRPDFILSSPYVRAKQTAQIAVEELRYEGELIETGELTPYANPHKTWEELREYRQAGEVIVVGHNPHMSDMACLLAGARSGAFEMKKSGLACFDLISTGPEPRATLNWLMTPRSCGA